MLRTFPRGFRWGVATSGHQTEGGNTGSDTWYLKHVRPTVFREPPGLACDSYRRWRPDHVRLPAQAERGRLRRDRALTEDHLER